MQKDGTHDVEYTQRIDREGVVLWRMKCKDCKRQSDEAAGQIGLETRKMIGHSHVMHTQAEAEIRRHHDR